MTQPPPFAAAASLRGAVDLSSLKRPLTPPGAAPAASSTDAGGLVVEVTDASIRDVLTASARHPVVLVVWSPRLQESADFVATVESVARRYQGRFQLATVDADTNPTILQAFQIRAVPVSFALLQGQPVPLFEGAQPEAQVAAVIDQLLTLAGQQGVTGTVAVGDPGPSDAEATVEEPALPPLHQAAFDAIESGDLDGAAAAYREALAQNPADTDARLGLAQVSLLQRTTGVDAQAARAAAAADPADVSAQTLVADLDVLGGHIEDAFTRLVDTVRLTKDAERNTARQHLVELFELVGASDELVVRFRKALMSALF